MKLKCQRCGIRGSADLAFVWYGKTFRPKGQKSGETTLWLCPDCRLDFASKGKCDSFLRAQV